METVLVTLAIYCALAFVLGLLARALGALVDFVAWIVAGTPPPITQMPAAPPSPRFPAMRLPKVGGY